MIREEDVIRIHQLLIEKFGGENGIRDEGLLLSAINRPFATFDGKDLYPSSLKKAAALLESILINHPFIDGNKRTGYVLMRLLLLGNNMDLTASEDEKFDLVIAVAKGEKSFNDIVIWLEKNSISI